MAARLMIEETRHPMEKIAQECGFVDLRRMRDAFMTAAADDPAAGKSRLRMAAEVKLLMRIELRTCAYCIQKESSAASLANHLLVKTNQNSLPREKGAAGASIKLGRKRGR
ncbi:MULTISPECIES: hypothetical protein [Rhizobium]|uniref:hypothetical protein n=1 Tax=Rhizobium TaxID=379 RepID=UPI00160D2286|nr:MULTISPECIES: hypothetical protein [Rhizobium]MBX5154082.1 hypothetical protein [Rhizobium lentis]